MNFTRYQETLASAIIDINKACPELAGSSYCHTVKVANR